MSVPILTAVAEPAREAALAASLAGAGSGVEVVRRCVDLADLLAAASAGLARAVVLSADLRRLDRETVSRLATAGVAVVGLVPAGDEAAEHRHRQLGIDHLVPDDAAAEEISSAVLAAAAAAAVREARPAPTRSGWADPASAVAAVRSHPPPARPAAGGRVIAIWGPAGAPGRSTVAVNLAAELAALGHRALLVDADTYGGSTAAMLGVLDEAPGVAAACRLANLGELDAARLESTSLEVRPGLAVLTGITRPDRWVEVRASALSAVLDLGRLVAAYVVVDCGFCLEQDEEIAYDTAAPRRNGATIAAVEAADIAVAVAAADPVGLARFVRAYPDCAALAGARPVVVANRLRRRVTGPGDPRREVAAALERFAGIDDLHAVPDDRDGCDAALAAGRSLGEAAPPAPARKAIAALAERLAGLPSTARRRRRRRRQQAMSHCR